MTIEQLKKQAEIQCNKAGYAVDLDLTTSFMLVIICPDGSRKFVNLLDIAPSITTGITQ